jgi:hypothetical protein
MRAGRAQRDGAQAQEQAVQGAFGGGLGDLRGGRLGTLTWLGFSGWTVDASGGWTAVTWLVPRT